MSLSFVSKTIQTANENGEFEEKPVENESETGVNRHQASSSGLFDQLRKNKDQEEAEREEFQRSIMRGTLTLNEEDAAHLDFLAKQKEKERTEMRNSTELALADFRSAQSERATKPQPKKMGDSFKASEVKSVIAPAVPNILVKKRKRVQAPEAEEGSAKPNEDATKPAKKCIANLLSGYSSSSDEE